MSEPTPHPLAIPEPQSKWFKLSEWNSRHPLARPYPAAWVETRWRALAAELDTIREDANCPIVVTPNGGFRTPGHNAAIGGKAKSQHMEGTAADIKARDLTPWQLHGLILRLHEAGKLPRLGGLGVYDHFVHVDVRDNGGHLARWDERGLKQQQTA